MPLRERTVRQRDFHGRMFCLCDGKTLANFPSQIVLPIVVARQGKASGKELPNPQNGS